MKINLQLNYIIIYFYFITIIPNILGIKTNILNSLKASGNELTIKGENFYDEIIIEQKRKINLYFDEDSFDMDDEYLLTILGNSIINFDVLPYNNDKDENPKVINLSIKKYFYNGYAIILNENIFDKYKHLRLELNLLESESELIYLRLRPILKKKKTISPNNHIDIILEKDDYEEECFFINDSDDIDYFDTNLSVVFLLKFLSYTKNMKAKLESYKGKTEIEINKESMTYSIKQNEYNRICFYLNGNNEIRGGLSIEFLNLNLTSDEYYYDPNNIVILNTYALIRGLSSEQYLPRGHVLSYKTDDYKFKDEITFLNIKFNMIQGKSKLFVEKCQNYPFCKYRKNDFINNFKDYEGINGFISVKKQLEKDVEKGKNYVILVYCPEEDNDIDCKYEISAKNEGEYTHLYKDKISYSFINLFGDSFITENYRIDLENIIGTDILYINFILFSGNAVVQFINSDNNELKDYESSYLGNKIVFTFKKEVLEENLNMNIKIKGDKHSYFSINYQFKNDDNLNEYHLEQGILEYSRFKGKNINNYIINNNNYTNNNIPIIININTCGKNIAIQKYNENMIINNNTEFHFIQLIFIENINGQNSFGLINNDNESKDEDKYLYDILFLNSNTQIQMNNGQNYINKLNQYNKEATYVYFLTKRIENNNKLIINFRKFSRNPVKISINIIKNNYKHYIINRLSKLILLNDEDIKNACGFFIGKEGENICKIIIKVKNEDNHEITEDSSTHIDYSIQITGSDEPFNPIYLPQSTFISNLLIPDFSQIYYVEVPKNGYGKIFVDFKEGGGYANAFLKNKKYNYEKEINFDYFNKYFNVDENLTQNCDEEEICKIYIYLTSYEYMYKYNIYSKLENKNTQSMVVPEYEYIYGNLNSTNIHKYIIKINKDAGELIINIDCDNCKVKILSIGADKIINIHERKKLIINEDFYDSIICLFIEQDYFLDIPDINYNFRVIYPGSIPITSLRNEFCQINEKFPCYYTIPIEKYNKIENIKFLIPDNEHVNIYYQIIDYETYDGHTDKEFLDEIKYNYTSAINKDHIQKNYVEKIITRNNKSDEMIYIFKIELNYSSEITVVSSHYNTMNYGKYDLQLNDFTILKLDNISKNISLTANNKGFYDIAINLMRGRGKIKILDDSQKIYLLDYKNQDNINLLVDSEINNKKELEAELYDGEEEFIIYAKVIINDYKNINRLVELNFQKNNYFDYIDIRNHNIIWPLNFYMKLNITSRDKESNNLELKNINLNYKLSNINNENEFQIKDFTEQVFNIKIYLVNQNYINYKKLNLDYSLIKELIYNLSYESNYRIDILSGYSLLKAKNILENLDNDINYYLYILIFPPENYKILNNNIKITFSVFDLTSNFNLPINEYLVMTINQETKLILDRKLEVFNNSVIEFVLDYNAFGFTIISEHSHNYYINDTLINCLSNDFEYYGKTILNKKFLDNDKNNKLFLYQKKNFLNEIKNQQLLIKYRLSNSNELYYFNLTNENVEYNSKENTITFRRIEENDIKEINEPTFIVYNIRIFDLSNNSKIFSNDILYNEKPYKIIKYINPDSDIINQIEIPEIPRGLFYISILAEAKKGNIHEYFTYKPKEINKITNETIIDIKITGQENYIEGKYSKSFIYKAEVIKNDGDFIKLSLKHKNNLDEKNRIYASNDNKFLNSQNLYRDSEYKIIDREESLVIPVKNVDKSFLFMKIPCNDICDYTLNYVIYKTNDIKIKDDECFDFEINAQQKFIYSISNANKRSLFTMTSYSLKDFKVSVDNGFELNKTYYNGFSYILNPMYNFQKKKIEFTIEANSIIKICHRTLPNNDLNIIKSYDYKDIVVGDKIYSSIENNKEECYKIYKKINEDISYYILSFISKTKNIVVDFYNSENFAIAHLNVDEESNNIIIESFLDHFCISIDNNIQNSYTYAGLLIHLLSINNNNFIEQNLNMPLIKGISTRQKLGKGQVIYYRINENSLKSNFINVHFQNITGSTKVFSSKCTDFPNCIFSSEGLDQKTEETIINNNIYFNIKIEPQEKDIYHKSMFPIVIVYCSNVDENEGFCNYYIEMSNDLDSKMLNQNRKIYSFIQSNEDETNYIFTLSKNNINKNNKLFIQINSFIGSANILVNNIKNQEETKKIESYYQFNNNTIFFIYNLDNNISEFNVKVNGEKNSFYSLTYYIINEDKNNKNGRNISLPSGEMHYSIITNPGLDYYYYFQERKKKNIENHYLVNINPINCKLKCAKEEEEYGENYQFLIGSNEKIKISYLNNLDINDICEFSISAVDYTHSRDVKNFKELIMNEGIYQNYHCEKEFKFNSTLYKYLISKREIKNDNIMIHIIKKTEINLVLEYTINNNIVEKNITTQNEIIEVNVKDINNNNNLEELYDFITINFVIHLETRAPQINVDFKIKVNGKNFPSYLNSEDIDYGIINKGGYVYYYFDYKKNEKCHIYFNCKGKAYFKVVSNINKNAIDIKSSNGLYYNNKFNLPKEDYFKTDKSNYNYFNIDNCSYDVCQSYVIIYIPKEDEYINKKALFNLYRYSGSSTINIPFNQTINGVLFNNNPNKFYNDITFKEPIKIFLNCKKCKMCYYTKEPRNQKDKEITCDNPFIPGNNKFLSIQNSIRDNINKIIYVIFSDNQKEDEIIYYSLYVQKSKVPKFIEQNIPEICEIPCKLILPIYQFYYYNTNNIILYIPNDQQTLIYEKIIKMEENKVIQDYDLINNNDNSSKSALISNKLVLNLEDIIKYNDNLYIEIQVISKLNENKNITFITSQFYNSLNAEIIPQFQNIYIINDNKFTENKNNILNNLIENNIYKIDINLIEGSGFLFLSNGNENNKYSLSYDAQEKISLILKKDNIYFDAEKNPEEENLIFYLSYDEKQNKKEYDELIFRKSNYLHYFRNNESNIFPINLKLCLNKNKNDLHINFRFSELIKIKKNDDSLINITDEKFDIKIYSDNNTIKTEKDMKDKENKEIKGIIIRYYVDLRRGYIYIDKSKISKEVYIDIVIDKSELNSNIYEKVDLDITPFDINNQLDFPRNNYLEMNLNKKREEIKLSKPLNAYKNVYLELASNDKDTINLSIVGKNLSKIEENIHGKNYYSLINDNKTEYIITLNSKNSYNIGTVLIKYITRKKNITNYNINKTNIEWTKINKDNYTFRFNHSNILLEDESNYKLNYLIRLYNSFSFENNKKPENILITEEPIFSFRKELTEKELKDNTIDYIVNFGNLTRGKYYINVLGEVIDDTNVEYYAYDYIEFTVKKLSGEVSFDFTWIIIIFIILFMLVFVIYFLVKVAINMKNIKENEDFLIAAKRNQIIYKL